MLISRRWTLLTASALFGTYAVRSEAGSRVVEHFRSITEINKQLVPAQVRKTRVTHVGGLEQAFFQDEFTKFANMPGCKIIMQNGIRFDHPEWANLPPWNEYLTLFSNRQLGQLDLSLEEVSDLILGDGTACRKLGLCGAALAAPNLMYRRNWSVQRYAQCLDRAGIDANALLDNCTIVENYEQLASHGRENPGQLLIGLGGGDFQGIRPTKALALIFIERRWRSSHPAS